jgi:hypothetical protein
MQPTEASRANRASAGVPAVPPTAAWRSTFVEVLCDPRLRVRCDDGTASEAAMQRVLRESGVVGTVFEPPRTPQFLHQRLSCRARCNGRPARILRPMRCTTPFALMGLGPGNEAALVALGSAGKVARELRRSSQW